MLRKLILIPLLLVIGCAHLTPGSDPLVVRTEQVQSGANATFDFVLHLDDNNRGLWRTNAPAFHNFCEWLRTPMQYKASQTVSRCVLMQLDVDDLKTDYKMNKSAANSNVLFTAVGTLSYALGQSMSWSNIIVTPTHN
jgi:hypothetical protein